MTFVSPPPNLEAQRAAMKKLEFLVGKWAGEARLERRGEALDLVQVEEAQYKLDGLIMIIEGVGRIKSEGVPIINALGVISYNDGSRTYRMRAFNDGRYFETEVKLSGEHKGMSWGIDMGENYMWNAVMRINEKDEWTEIHEITFGSQPPIRFLEVAVRRQS